MNNIREIEKNIYRIGVSDRKLTIFEAVYPIAHGVAYNSYLITDKKTALIDTVEKSCAKQFFENLEAGLNGRTLDYLIVQHLEPDHASLIQEVIEKYPSVEVLCSQKASDMIKQFNDITIEYKNTIIKEGDTLSLGEHNLAFVAAPMVHWPEVMVTYESTTKTLFSADGFGSFGAVNGNISDMEYDIDAEYINEARRYYTNIVGKYGMQVQMLLKKAATLDIKRICPLHGLILEKNIPLFIEKYDKWSKYEPETNGVVVAYSSVYGNTENAVEILISKLAQKGIRNIKVFDTSITHKSFILAEMFKHSHIIIATTTYNNDIFVTMDELLNTMVSHGLKNRKFAIMQNGSWVPNCGAKIKEKISKLQNTEFINEEVFSITSSLKQEQIDDIEDLANKICASVNK